MAQLKSAQSKHRKSAAGTRYFMTRLSRKAAKSSRSRPVQARKSQVKAMLMIMRQQSMNMES